MIVSVRASAFRPRVAAISRMKAAASCVAFCLTSSGRSPPAPDTGDAAPMFVTGAIAATCADAAMKVPADAALAPEGETYTTTGTGDSWIAPTMSRVELSRPPGVSSVTIATRAPSSSAVASARSTYRAATACMDPSISINAACGD